MIKIERQQDCCGCTACEQSCHKQAITMTQDKNGFTYPNVNVKLCGDCGLCNKSCPIQNENKPRIPEHTYAIKHKDENIRKNSSSGGAFSVFAKKTLEKGGIICGATFDNDWNVKHIIIDRIDQIAKLYGSKYVQSDLHNIFRQIKEKLQEGIPVLFSGTPCQVAGLLKFLGRRYSNLTTIDFICHGVPTPKIWKDYLEEVLSCTITKTNNNTQTSSKVKPIIANINFRDKSEGWIKFHLVIKVKDKPNDIINNTLVDEYIWENDYMRAFLNDYINRPSCHECHFRNGKSGSDYTIADYWGIDKLYPDFFDDNGVSLLLSYNGDIPEYIKTNTEYIETSFNDACFGNLCIKSSWPFRPVSRFFFFLHNHLGCSIHNSLKITTLSEKYCGKIKETAKRIQKKLTAK